MIEHMTRIRSFKFDAKILVDEVLLGRGSSGTALRLCLQISNRTITSFRTSFKVDIVLETNEGILTSIGVSDSSGSSFC